jgi:site-specific DNA recombinase
VQRIFAEYLAGRGLYAIAEGLTKDRVPCPSAHDPARNRHRTGQAWSKAAVRAILRNPRYTGRQVWNKQRKDEVLIDVDDVALGHQAKLRWNPEGDWIWSNQVVHEPLIDADTFADAQAAAATPARPVRRKPRATGRPYQLRGLIHCGVCQRRMEGTWAHDAARYRCKYPAEYALANEIDHPRTVYVREDQILPPLDRWLAGLFAPSSLDATLDALIAAADEPDSGLAAAITAARRALADCDARIAKYRAALEAGADPVLVAGWLAEVQAERALLDRQLRDAPAPDSVRRDDLAEAVRRHADAVALLQRAHHQDKSRLYASLGLRLTYQPDQRRVLASCQPVYQECVRGGT